MTGTAHVEGHTMALVVSHQPVTVEAQVQSHARLCAICGGQIGTQINFPPSSSVFSSSVHKCSIVIPSSMSDII
jgi:hypothetical protein